MRGQDQLIAMRKNGIKPKIVFINDFKCDTARDWSNPGSYKNWEWPSDHATISTAGGPLSSIDLRCCVDLIVSITSDDSKRAMAIFEKAKQAGASIVAASHDESGWTEIYRVEEVQNA
jgi:hypothetical protein